MSHSTSLDDLLLHYEELHEQGRMISPEELCGEDTELLEELRREIHGLGALNALLWAAGDQEDGDPMPLPDSASSGHDAASAEALATGARYQVLRLLARGGLGEVYVAREEALNREVALKRIQGLHAQGAKSRARFLVEAEITSRLEHPNIVPVYALGQDAGGRPFYAMRFVQGETLEQMIRRFHDADKPGRNPRERRLALRQLLSRFVAVCNTVAYAHSRGILHRDIKPGNVLLGKYGETLLMDWGLAKPLAESCEQPTPNEELLRPRGGSDVEGTQMGSVLGTPAFMSPEQAAGRWDSLGPASDIYSLGATLYALLTGRSPFQGSQTVGVLEQVKRGAFPPPRQQAKEVPRALEAICLKAMALKPEDRYATALSLAADLEHWLADEPVSAWREPWAIGVRRWLGRHRAWVAAGAAILLVVTISLAAATFLLQAANQRTGQARRRAELESHLQQIRRVRLTTHSNGWSDEVWKEVGAAAGISKEDRLRNEAAATLAGIEARVAKHFPQPASSVAFDPAGRRLLVGGISDHRDGKALTSTQIWDSASDTILDTWQARAGPVAFGPNGTPLQLVAGDWPTLRLWDVGKGQPVRGYPFTSRPGEPAVTAFSLNDLKLPVLAMTPDAYLVAASAGGPTEQGTVAVWRGTSGELLGRSPGKATALAFSAEGSFLAIGTHEGRITVQPLGPGVREPVVLPGPRRTIHCLAFSPDNRRLAAGGAGGTVTVWDLADKHTLFCPGSIYDVYAVAFSPDGTLLASGGRGHSKLWDAATGQLLLNLNSGDVITGLTFSANARKLAVSSRGFVYNGHVYVWDLEHGRGIQTLQGLSNQISYVVFSPDGRLLAALAHNWQVAIWQVEPPRLLHVLDMPEGASADNAGLAFSPDGQQFAFSAGTEASLWDVAPGRKRRSWPLPLGGNDVLAFPGTGRLLLFRSEPHPNKKTRIYSLRQLSPPGRLEVTIDDEEIVGWPHRTAASLDGSCFVVQGKSVLDNPVGRARWCIKGFDGRTGKERWKMELKSGEGFASCDPEGRLLATRFDPGVAPEERLESRLVDMSSGEVLRSLKSSPTGCLSPGMRFLVRNGPLDVSGLSRGYALHAPEDETPLLVLGLETLSYRPTFNREGNLLAWGNHDGTVTVCNLPAIRARLAEVELDW
jgi:WD40 repeat protein